MLSVWDGIKDKGKYLPSTGIWKTLVLNSVLDPLESNLLFPIFSAQSAIFQGFNKWLLHKSLQVPIIYFIKEKCATSQPCLYLSFYLIQIIKVMGGDGIYSFFKPFESRVLCCTTLATQPLSTPHSPANKHMHIYHSQYLPAHHH